MAFNKDQWIDSFQSQLAILRPHLSERVLASMSLSAWHGRGRKDEDPIEAARQESKALDLQAKKGPTGASSPPRTGQSGRSR